MAIRDLMLTGNGRAEGFYLTRDIQIERANKGLSRLLKLLADGRLRTLVSIDADWSTVGPTAARLMARDFARDADVFLLTYENVRTALARFEEKEIETLPVLDSPTEHKIVGYLTEQYALRRYNQALERRRSADLGERDLFSIAEPPR